ncbi:hypothetical protein TCAL_05253 [Tigriopus californicus]|uniref:PIN domain-containing protein n=1 Tax=Tigriopus californicus TaxID=6832 RepID=A0A553NR44_TIGCA|nr:nonsense-mediated mRNA decay factor SMG5-like [Tigriopus californicus]TRY67907.1 hypothetical protein TCAL_05253 [Tigriopus californicus]
MAQSTPIRHDPSKVQRSIYEVVKRVESVHAQCGDIQSLFTPEVLFLRGKLWDYTLRLCQCDPALFALKALDLFWLKSIHGTLTRARQLTRGWTPMEQAYLQGHLAASVSQMRHCQDWLTPPAGWTPLIEYGELVAPPPPTRGREKWRRILQHKLLVYLGDLTRYALSFQAEASPRLPAGFYARALALEQAHGAPFNQLASLCAQANYGLSSAFLYLRSMHTSEPFAGARTNLEKLVTKNSREWRKLQNQLDQRGPPQVETEWCIRLHIELINCIVLGEATSDLSDICQRALEAFQRCLYIPMQDVDYASHDLLSEEVVDEMILSLLVPLTNPKLSASKKAMLNAYLLALFTHVVSKMLGDVTLKFFGPEALLKVFEPDEPQPKDTPDDPTNGIAKAEAESEEKSKSKRTPKPQSILDKRRRRKPRGLSDSETDPSESDNDSKTDPSTSKSMRDDETTRNLDSSSSEFSFSDLESESGILATDSEDEDDDDDDSDVIVESSRNLISTLGLVRVLKKHHLNGGFRILSSWLLNSEKVLQEASKSSDVFWSRLSRFFSLLDFTNSEYTPNDEVNEAIVKVKDLVEVGSYYPESELMAGMTNVSRIPPPSSNTNDDIEEALSKLNELEKGTLQILHFQWIRDRFCESPLTNLQLEENGLVTFKVKNTTTHEPVTTPKEEKVDSSAEKSVEMTKEKEQMMEQMAKLWLQQEVNDLEGKTKSLRGYAHYSPYLVLDHFALSEHLELIKDIVYSKKFAVIVPTVVIHDLDDMKKSSPGARNAIRWLEKQFHQGNRWLRPQRPNEKKPLELLTYPKKKEREATNYFQIFECCNHFSVIRGESSAANKIQVTLLTSGPKESETRTYDPRGVAGSIGIKVENVNVFYVGKSPSERRKNKHFHAKKKKPKSLVSRP